MARLHAFKKTCFVLFKENKFTVFFLSRSGNWVFSKIGDNCCCLAHSNQKRKEKKRSVIRFSWDFNRFADWMNWDYLWRLGIKIDTNDTQFIVNVDECWTDNNNNLLLRQNGISQKWNKWNDLAVVVVFSIPCAIIDWNRIVQYQNAIEMEQRNGNETMWQHNERKWKRIAYREMSSWRHHHHCHCCRRRLRSAIEATNEYIDPFMWLKHYSL